MKVRDGLSLLLCSLSIMAIFMWFCISGVFNSLHTFIYFALIGLVGFISIKLSLWYAKRNVEQHDC